MEIAIVEYFKPQHFEVWLTDQIKIGAGMGDVFDTRAEAFQYAQESGLPILDISGTIIPMIEDDEVLRYFLGQYLELNLSGDVMKIRSEI